MWERHLINCAVMSEMIPIGASVIDVGSGAGLPGIVLAVARPDLTITLVEPLARRTAFLSEAVTALGLDSTVTVVRGRAEDIAGGPPAAADVVTARAVAPLDRLAGWCLPLAAIGGRLLALKGASAAEEVAEHRDGDRPARRLRPGRPALRGRPDRPADHGGRDRAGARASWHQGPGRPEGRPTRAAPPATPAAAAPGRGDRGGDRWPGGACGSEPGNSHDPLRPAGSDGSSTDPLRLAVAAGSVAQERACGRGIAVRGRREGSGLTGHAVEARARQVRRRWLPVRCPAAGVSGPRRARSLPDGLARGSLPLGRCERAAGLASRGRRSGDPSRRRSDPSRLARRRRGPGSGVLDAWHFSDAAADAALEPCRSRSVQTSALRRVFGAAGRGPGRARRLRPGRVSPCRRMVSAWWPSCCGYGVKLRLVPGFMVFETSPICRYRLIRRTTVATLARRP